MISLPSILLLLKKGDWMATLGLQDTCFHITTHWLHRKFLCFAIGMICSR